MCRTYIDFYVLELGSHGRIVSINCLATLSLATFLYPFPAQLLNPNFWELESVWPIFGQVPACDPGS